MTDLHEAFRQSEIRAGDVVARRTHYQRKRDAEPERELEKRFLGKVSEHTQATFGERLP